MTSLITYPIDGLMSYHYFRQPEPITEFLASGRLRVIGDSGAFSAYSLGKDISLGDFAKWGRRHASRLYWIASLDVIGDANATAANWHRLHDDHGLDTVPTLHVGGDYAWMDYYAKRDVDFMGLGGGAGDPAAWKWVVHAFAYAKRHHPQMRFHGWAVTRFDAVAALPWYSVDSSGTVSSAYRFAAARVWHPERGKLVNIKLNGRDIWRHALWLRKHYPALDPKLVATSHPGNRDLLVHWLTASTQLFAAWAQKRHKVSAPSWGINTACHDNTGPRVHIAETATDCLRHMTQGPRINVCLSPEDFGRAANISQGPRVHIVDTGVPNLRAMTTDNPTVKETL